jgi:hypothetical protein
MRPKKDDLGLSGWSVFLVIPDDLFRQQGKNLPAN